MRPRAGMRRAPFPVPVRVVLDGPRQGTIRGQIRAAHDDLLTVPPPRLRLRWRDLLSPHDCPRRTKGRLVDLRRRWLGRLRRWLSLSHASTRVLPPTRLLGVASGG